MPELVKVTTKGVEHIGIPQDVMARLHARAEAHPTLTIWVANADGAWLTFAHTERQALAKMNQMVDLGHPFALLHELT